MSPGPAVSRPGDGYAKYLNERDGFAPDTACENSTPATSFIIACKKPWIPPNW